MGCCVVIGGRTVGHLCQWSDLQVFYFHALMISCPMMVCCPMMVSCTIFRPKITQPLPNYMCVGFIWMCGSASCSAGGAVDGGAVASL